MLTILVIEDDPRMQQAAKIVLEQLGWQVLAAWNGPAGIELAQQERPDVVLLDLGLPGMSGLEVCQHLRTVPETLSIPILVQSGEGEEAMDRALASGASGYLAKPWRVDTLIRKIRELVPAA